MEASYLRIKNWGKLQHYSDRRPPWIKLYQGLLGDDDDFARLDEATQWQLVRIWIVASRSSAITVDDGGHQVPVVANDAASLQRSIQSLKKVPLAKLIREGWLIPVDEDGLLPVEKVSKRPRRASKGASTVQAASIEAEVSEVSELDSLPGRHSDDTGPLGPELADAIDRARAASERLESLPIEIEFQVGRLTRLIGDHADEGTRHVIASYARRLPQASLAKVIESIETNHPQDRAAYAVGALRDELTERSNAA